MSSAFRKIKPPKRLMALTWGRNQQVGGNKAQAVNDDQGSSHKTWAF